jgi:hypothetical protein
MVLKIQQLEGADGENLLYVEAEAQVILGFNEQIFSAGGSPNVFDTQVGKVSHFREVEYRHFFQELEPSELTKGTRTV